MKKETKLSRTSKPPDTNLEDKPHGCRGFLREGRCSDCGLLRDEQRLTKCHEYLQRYTKIPHCITDTFMPLTTGNEWKILEYIVRHADFNPGSHNYGKAFIRYADLISTTNIKQPQKPLAELEKRRLIRKIHTRHKSIEGVKTVNTIIVRWMKPLKKLSEEKHMAKATQAVTADAAIPFEQYLKQYDVDKETVTAIKYYLTVFKKHRKKQHPNLKDKQWEQIVKTFLRVEMNGDEKRFEADWIKPMIDRYFEHPPKGTKDFHIHHFNSQGIKEKLAFKEAIY